MSTQLNNLVPICYLLLLGGPLQLSPAAAARTAGGMKAPVPTLPLLALLLALPSGEVALLPPLALSLTKAPVPLAATAGAAATEAFGFHPAFAHLGAQLRRRVSTDAAGSAKS